MIWYLVAFLAGWLACWYLSRFVMRHVLRRGDGFMVDVLTGLPHDSLLKVNKTIDREIQKRRGEPNQDSERQ